MFYKLHRRYLWPQVASAAMATTVHYDQRPQGLRSCIYTICSHRQPLQPLATRVHYDQGPQGLRSCIEAICGHRQLRQPLATTVHYDQGPQGLRSYIEAICCHRQPRQPLTTTVHFDQGTQGLRNSISLFNNGVIMNQKPKAYEGNTKYLSNKMGFLPLNPLRSFQNIIGTKK